MKRDRVAPPPHLVVSSEIHSVITMIAKRDRKTKLVVTDELLRLALSVRHIEMPMENKQ